jgi:5-methylcytosine-specific restriction endonuclease McrA
MLSPKYHQGTYLTRELYAKVAETNDLRYVWAYANAQKWRVDYDKFLMLCHDNCDCCQSKLNYGIGRNNPAKTDTETPSTDHIIPRSMGGDEYDIANMWVICKRCNTFKNNAQGEEDIRRLENLVAFLKLSHYVNNSGKEILNGNEC